MSKLHRILWTTFRVLLAGLCIGAVIAGSLWWYFHPEVVETRGIVYTRRTGQDLTLDVFRPAKQNGIGVLVMVSGSWKSNTDGFRVWMAAPLLRQGHTVIAVSHLSQPKASVMETVADVQHAVRFVRHHADEYGIDAQRLAVTGGSSGGHLSLMLATCGGPGPADATDPVDREDSSVQAAAVFFPVTDLLNLGPSTQNAHDGGPPRSFRQAFGPKGTDPETWKQIGHDFSPIYHITPALPPIIIAHGDADTLVPLEQSERFQQRAAELGHTIHLEVRPGKKHGWMTMLWDARIFGQWFSERLPPRPALAAP